MFKWLKDTFVGKEDNPTGHNTEPDRRVEGSDRGASSRKSREKASAPYQAPKPSAEIGWPKSDSTKYQQTVIPGKVSSDKNQRFLECWCGDDSNRKEVLTKVKSLHDVMKLKEDDIVAWPASDNAKDEMRLLQTWTKANLLEEVRIRTVGGKKLGQNFEKRLFLDITSIMGRCLITPLIKDDPLDETERVTWSLSPIKDVNDLWKKIGITPNDAVAHFSGDQSFWNKLTWLPNLGNKSGRKIGLLTLRKWKSSKSFSPMGQRNPGETHAIIQKRTLRQMFIVLRTWDKNIPERKSSAVRSEGFMSLRKELGDYEILLATDGENDTKGYLKEKAFFLDCITSKALTEEYILKPCFEKEDIVVQPYNDHMIENIYKLRCAMNLIEDFKKTEINKISTGAQEKLNELQDDMEEQIELCQKADSNDADCEALLNEVEDMKELLMKDEEVRRLVCAASLSTEEELTRNKVINVVLIGKTGSGKSATGSLLLGYPCFKSSAGISSETKPKDLKVREVTMDGVTFRILDTPGLFDTKSKQIPFMLAIEKIATEFPEGVHVIAYVMRAGRFTKEEADTVKIVTEKNGTGQFKHMPILVTKSDSLLSAGKPIDQYLKEVEENKGDKNIAIFRNLVKEVDRRVAYIENVTDSELYKDCQRNLLCHLMREIADSNKGPYRRDAWRVLKELHDGKMEGLMDMVLDFLKKKRSESKHHKRSSILDIPEKKLKSWITEFIRDIPSLGDVDRKLLVDFFEQTDRGKVILQEREQKASEGGRQATRTTNKDEIRNIVRKKLFESIEISKGPDNSTKNILGDVDELHKHLKEAIDEVKAIYDDVAEEEFFAVEEEMELILNELKCFPPSAVIETDMGTKPISELKVGDKVLSSSSNGDVIFSPVVMFSHMDMDVEGIYTVITTQNNKMITLSPNHLIHEGKLGNLKAARLIEPGNIVFITKGKNTELVKVISVGLTYKTGAVCPHTTSGNIIVDGVVASCYTTLIYPPLAHLLMLPLRVLYHVVPSYVFKWLIMYDSKQGMPVLLSKMRDVLF